MKLIEIEKPTEGEEQRTGTLVALRFLLGQHPDAANYDHQLKMADIFDILDNHKGKDQLELSESEFDWIQEKLKTANFTGVNASNLVRAFVNAGSLDPTPKSS